MSLTIRDAAPGNVFALLGADENSATYALGWMLERSPRFASLAVRAIAGRDVDTSALRVTLQTAARDRGYTDVELRCGTGLHAIIEAKRGFGLPTPAQLRRYRPRLDATPRAARLLVSTSALPAEIAALRLPSGVDGVPLRHLSWGALRALAKQARAQARSFEERLWLREFIHHLEGYAAMDRVRDNRVYVVSLGSTPMCKGGQRTWIDVVEQDGRYFHPVGNHWPQQPPNYLGFRYRGQLRSVHHVESYVLARDLAQVDPSWPTTSTDHFVYTLGPAMRPARPMQAGSKGDSILRSARVWCAIDTLLSGRCERLGDAVAATKRRQADAESSDA